ncbi:MAG: hypothetical protein MZU97_16900 [Bacillus subtilis]|nr:hypothetical protein [Bacillus subtilis]
MVTHNAEFAEAYSTQIIRLRDGVVVDDSRPVRQLDELRNQLSTKKDGDEL